MILKQRQYWHRRIPIGLERAAAVAAIQSESADIPIMRWSFRIVQIGLFAALVGYGLARSPLAANKLLYPLWELFL